MKIIIFRPNIDPKYRFINISTGKPENIIKKTTNEVNNAKKGDPFSGVRGLRPEQAEKEYVSSLSSRSPRGQAWYLRCLLFKGPAGPLVF